MLRLAALLLVMSALSGCVASNTKPAISNNVITTKTARVAENDVIRVITPFARPRVVTRSNAAIEQSQHVLYVLPEDRQPISMFVIDDENEARSITLELIPSAEGVRQVDLAMNKPREGKASQPTKAATVKAKKDLHSDAKAIREAMQIITLP